MTAPLTFPDDFATLELEHRGDGGLLCRLSALQSVCIANGLSPVDVFADEGRAMEMIAAWYLDHRERGGAPDDVAEAILARLAAGSSEFAGPH